MPNILDAANRGIVAGTLGAPVDLSTGVVNAGLMGAGLLGHQLGLLNADQMPQPIAKPFLGSEWIGDRMQDAGMVSGERQPLAEFLAGMAAPGAGAAKVPALMEKVSPLLGFLGAMSAEGKARLLADLKAGFGSGRYRLGDVTEGQGKGLDALFGRETSSRDVYMTDDALRHLLERRLQDQGFSAEDVTRFAEQAMARRSRPELYGAASDQNPSLLQEGLRDMETGARYRAQMPFKQTQDGYEVRSVIPRGIDSRNKKASD